MSEEIKVTQITPTEFETLLERTIRKVISEKQVVEAVERDCWFDINELCEYRPDKPSKATVYNEVHLGAIPVHKRTKKLMFLKSEIDAWLKKGRKLTVDEAAVLADKHLSSNKKGLHNGK